MSRVKCTVQRCQGSRAPGGIAGCSPGRVVSQTPDKPRARSDRTHRARTPRGSAIRATALTQALRRPDVPARGASRTGGRDPASRPPEARGSTARPRAGDQTVTCALYACSAAHRSPRPAARRPGPTHPHLRGPRRVLGLQSLPPPPAGEARPWTPTGSARGPRPVAGDARAVCRDGSARGGRLARSALLTRSPRPAPGTTPSPPSKTLEARLTACSTARRSTMGPSCATSAPGSTVRKRTASSSAATAGSPMRAPRWRTPLPPTASTTTPEPPRSARPGSSPLPAAPATQLLS